MIPIQSSYFALEGTQDLLETVEKIRERANPELVVLGFLITLLDKRTVLSRDVEKRIRQTFGELTFKTSITRSIRLEESPAHGESILTFAPKSSGATEYRKLGTEILKRVKNA